MLKTEQTSPIRHTGEGRYPARPWVPASAGTTESCVMEIQKRHTSPDHSRGAPACGVTAAFGRGFRWRLGRGRSKFEVAPKGWLHPNHTRNQGLMPVSRLTLRDE